MTETHRLFVGVRVSVGCANLLAGAAETLARRARDAGIAVSWVPPANYHVTLKFLGWTRADAIGAARDAITAAVGDAPELADLRFRAARLGGFPSIEQARVLWAGVEGLGSAALGALAARVEQATVALGFAGRGDQPFHPHVTLGRIRDARPIRELILPIAEQMFSETRTDAVSLFESETKSGASIYREIARIPFKAPAGARISGVERQTQPVHLGAQDAPNDTPETPETDDGWPRGHGP